MTRPSYERQSPWGSALLALVLAGGVVVSAVAAWQARTTWQEHQRAVARALDEYAGYAARSLYQAQNTEGLLMHERAMAAPLAGSSYDGASLTLDRFARSVDEAVGVPAGLATDTLGGHFRIQVASGRYEGRGLAADSGIVTTVRQLAGQARLILDTTRTPVMLQTDVAGERASFHFAMHRDAAGRPLAIYGYMMSRRARAAMIDSALPRTLHLPRVGAIERADTMVALRIVEQDGVGGAAGRVHYESPRQFSSTATGTFSPPESPELVVQATLNPALVARLRGELLDDEWRRMQLVFPILSALFLIAALVYVWLVVRNRMS